MHAARHNLIEPKMPRQRGTLPAAVAVAATRSASSAGPPRSLLLTSHGAKSLDVSFPYSRTSSFKGLGLRTTAYYARQMTPRTARRPDPASNSSSASSSSSSASAHPSTSPTSPSSPSSASLKAASPAPAPNAACALLKPRDGRLPPNVPPWTPQLYAPHPAYPDNYVPPTFLSSLSTLTARPRPSLSTLVVAALPISEHLSVIGVFVGVFWGMLDGRWGPGGVGWGMVLVGAGVGGTRTLGWGRTGQAAAGKKGERGIYGECHADLPCWHPILATPRCPPPSCLPRSSCDGADPPALLPPNTPLRPLLLPPLLLALLSPVLGTLTSATTSDTIWPLASAMFFIHLLLADHTTGPDARRLRNKRRRVEASRRQRRMSTTYQVPIETLDNGSSDPHEHLSPKERVNRDGGGLYKRHATVVGRIVPVKGPDHATDAHVVDADPEGAYDTDPDSPDLSSSLSLTSALSASVVLASRLPSTSHVFALVLLAVGLFAGWPAVAKGIRVRLLSFYLPDTPGNEKPDGRRNRARSFPFFSPHPWRCSPSLSFPPRPPAPSSIPIPIPIPTPSPTPASRLPPSPHSSSSPP